MTSTQATKIAQYVALDRWKRRSRTYQGIADAMADQWEGQASTAPRKAMVHSPQSAFHDILAERFSARMREVATS